MTDKNKTVKPVTKNGQVVSLPNIPYGKGKELLKKGNRRSVGNTKEGGEIPNLDRLMEALNINLQDRMKNRRGNNDPRSRRERLSGLFGGDR